MLKELFIISIIPGYDSCVKQHKVGIKLMCPFVEKLLKLKKKYAAAGRKGLKRTVTCLRPL